MRARFDRALAVLAWLSGGALIVAALGWLPTREPEPPQRTQLEVARTVEPLAPSATPSEPMSSVAAPQAWLLPICKAPARGARLFRLPWFQRREVLLIWCDGGFSLVDVELAESGPRATRLARFRTRAELPGGAAAADFDGDGVLDLVLGTTAPPDVVHRPGVGAYWVRGRPQGGFEPSHTLVETSIVAAAPVEFDRKPGSDLALLVRGNLTAQRPGELWLFAGGAAMLRAATVPLGLSPRDLRVLPSEPIGMEAWIALSQPGALWRVMLRAPLTAGTPPATQVLPLPGAQGFVEGTAGTGLLLVRDVRSVRRVVVASEPSLATWAEGVNVGPSTLADLDGDGQPDLIAATSDGVARVVGAERSVVEELPLSATVFDVTRLVDDDERERALALVSEPDSGELGLLLLPEPPWSPAAKWVSRPGDVRDAASFGSVTLE